MIEAERGTREGRRPGRLPLVGWYVLMVPSIAAALLVVVPPPTHGLWVASVYAIEISLLFVPLAVAGLALAMIVRRRGRRRVGTLLAVLSVLALLANGVPTAQAYSDAVMRDVALSPVEYVAGLVPGAPGSPETVTYARVDGADLRLDVWRSGAADRPRPAVVVVHGGGWETGARSGYPRWDSWLVQRGYVVFDIDYRLVPPPRWRDAVGDVKCAVGWVRGNAGRYGVDPARIGLLGRSAGGQLALLAAYTPNDSRLPASCAAPDPSVAAVVALYPPADLAYIYDVGPSWSHPPATTDDGRRLLRGFTGGTPAQVPDAYRLASPIEHVSAGVPPTLLVQGGRDRLKVPADTARLAARLRAAGVRCDLVEIGYADHAFDANWAGWGSQLLRPALSGFLTETMRTVTVP